MTYPDEMDGVSHDDTVNSERRRSLADDPAAVCGHEELVETIITWSKAYPLSVFPEPPKGEHGQTIDTCSARALRHAFGVLGGMLDVAAEGEQT